MLLSAFWVRGAPPPPPPPSSCHAAAELVATARRGTVGPPAAGGGGVFMGMPLQTPMPFAGEALAVPITLFTQKRGGGGGGRARTKAVAAPDAAVITTAGMWHVCCCLGACRVSLDGLSRFFAALAVLLLQMASSGRWAPRGCSPSPTATARRSATCSPPSSTSLRQRSARRCFSVAAAKPGDDPLACLA